MKITLRDNRTVNCNFNFEDNSFDLIEKVPITAVQVFMRKIDLFQLEKFKFIVTEVPEEHSQSNFIVDLINAVYPITGVLYKQFIDNKEKNPNIFKLINKAVLFFKDGSSAIIESKEDLSVLISIISHRIEKSRSHSISPFLSIDKLSSKEMEINNEKATKATEILFFNELFDENVNIINNHILKFLGSSSNELIKSYQNMCRFFNKFCTSKFTIIAALIITAYIIIPSEIDKFQTPQDRSVIIVHDINYFILVLLKLIFVFAFTFAFPVAIFYFSLSIYSLVIKFKLKKMIINLNIELSEIDLKIGEYKEQLYPKLEKKFKPIREKDALSITCTFMLNNSIHDWNEVGGSDNH